MSTEINHIDKPNRLLSLDALRGFDMIWILGAEGIFAALFVLTGWPVWQVFEQQFKHSQWHGFTFYDLIFPLFIFLSGVTLGISKMSLIGADFEQRKPVYLKALRRLFLLLVLGVIYNHGWGKGVPPDLEKIRFASVLLRIGLAWFFCAVIVWHFTREKQVIIFVTLLIGYWIFQVYVPTPTGFSGALTIDQSWNAWFDQNLLPGMIHRNKPADPEGILSTIPAIANALGGALAGAFLMQSKFSAYKKVFYLFAAGVVALVAAWLWSFILPFNKALWTSSFALITIAYSLLLLAAFYLIFDVWKNPRLANFFAVIGVNAIALYLLTSIFSWYRVVQSLFGSSLNAVPEAWQPLLIVVALVMVQWSLAKFLSVKKIFFKV